MKRKRIRNVNAFTKSAQPWTTIVRCSLYILTVICTIPTTKIYATNFKPLHRLVQNLSVYAIQNYSNELVSLTKSFYNLVDTSKINLFQKKKNLTHMNNKLIPNLLFSNIFYNLHLTTHITYN